MSTGTDGHDASTAELVRQAAEQASRLVRGEMQLARAELKEKGRRAGVGASMMGSAALFAAFGAGAVVAAGILLFDLVLPAWASALIVAGVLLVIAGLLALVGRQRLAMVGPPMPQGAVRGMRADAQQLRERVHR